MHLEEIPSIYLEKNFVHAAMVTQFVTHIEAKKVNVIQPLGIRIEMCNYVKLISFMEIENGVYYFFFLLTPKYTLQMT